MKLMDSKSVAGDIGSFSGFSFGSFRSINIFDEYDEFYESVMAWENNCSQQY